MRYSIMFISASIFVWSVLHTESLVSSFGPIYPITTSLFQDRFSSDLWDDALGKFSQEGGDAVWLEGPPLVRRSKSDLKEDPVFKWCKGTEYTSGDDDVPDCYDQAEIDLTKDGIKIKSFASYQYEEDFGEAIMRCPHYDRRIVTVNVYYRLVLPTKNVSDPCTLNGSDVIVLFTSLSDVDPHEVLIKSAMKLNYTVFFGLPKVPRSWGSSFDGDLMPAYYELVRRILNEHKIRYININQTLDYAYSQAMPRKTSYDVISGYFISDVCNLGTVHKSRNYIELYSNLSQIMHNTTDKKLAVAAKIDLTKFGMNKTINDHQMGFVALVQTSADVIVVHEGRGYGTAAYFWPNEVDLPIKLIDPTLNRILTSNVEKWKTNGTFGEAYTGSIHDLFATLGNTSQYLKSKDNNTFEFWLGIEAFENLKDQLCFSSSNVHSDAVKATVDRTSKSRIDQALTHSAAFVQGVMAFSWDPDFTCTTKSHKRALSEEIETDAGRPIVVDCFLLSPSNKSVAVLGFNLAGQTQKYHVDWPDRNGMRRHISVHGYSLQLDYGIKHHLVPSMQFVQIWDAENENNLADTGYITVNAISSYHKCVFSYDDT